MMGTKSVDARSLLGKYRSVISPDIEAQYEKLLTLDKEDLIGEIRMLDMEREHFDDYVEDCRRILQLTFKLPKEYCMGYVDLFCTIEMISEIRPPYDTSRPCQIDHNPVPATPSADDIPPTKD